MYVFIDNYVNTGQQAEVSTHAQSVVVQSHGLCMSVCVFRYFRTTPNHTPSPAPKSSIDSSR